MALGGSSSAATLVVKVVTDASGATKGFDEAARGTSKFRQGMTTVGKYGAVASAAILAFGADAFRAASDAEQAAGAVDAVFKDNAKVIHDFARSAAQDTGMSAGAYEEMAAVFGAQLKNMGTDAEDLAPVTDDLIGLGADLAAQFGGSTSDAVAALSSLLRGERDPIERYGVGIKEADVQARKAALGLDNLTGEADKQATLQATLSLLFEQTADSAGAFARESNTAAGQQQRANAAFEDAKVSLGQVLLPIVAKAAEVFAKVAKFIGENSLAFQIFAGVVVGVTSAIWLFNAAVAANPIVLFGIAIAAVVAGVILLWKNCETFRKIVKKAGEIAVAAFRTVVKFVGRAWDAVRGVWNWIKSNWPKLLAILTGPVGIAVYAIIRNWDRIKAAITSVIRMIRGALATAWSWLRDRVVGVATTIRNWVQNVITKLSSLATFIRNSVVAAFRRMRDVALLIFTFIRDKVQWVIDKLNQLRNFIGKTVVNALLWLKDVALLIFTFIRDRIQGVIDRLGTFVGWIRDTAGSAFRTLQWVGTVALNALLAPINAVIWAISTLAGWVRNTLASAFQVAQWVGTVAFNALLGPIQWVIDKVSALIGWIANIKFPSPPGWLSKAGSWLNPFRSLPPPLPPAPAPARYRVAAPTARTLRGGGLVRTGGGAGSGVTINVNGALDPDAVARQIERILTTRSRRVTGARLVGVR